MENDFDTFFVGDGSAKLMGITNKDSKNKDNINSNFLDGFNISDNKFTIENDINDFIVTERIIKDGCYNKVFIDSKRAIFNKFDFLAIKSMGMKSIVIKEEDLIITDEDINFINFMKQFNITDFYAVYSIACVSAYKEMGIKFVSFVSLDDCPLCKSYHGIILSIDNIIRSLLDGDFISHPYCMCDFFPIITREDYFGPLDKYLDIKTINIGDKIIHNFPIEFNYNVFKDNLLKIPFNKISFINMRVKSDHENLVTTYDEDKKIFYIHNSYIGSYGPEHFVNGYLKSDNIPRKIDTNIINNSEKYWLCGKKVIKSGDHYWDEKTGTLIK